MVDQTIKQKNNALISDIMTLNETQDSLLGSIAWICTFYKIEISEAALSAGAPKTGKITPTGALGLMEHIGLSGAWSKRGLSTLSSFLLPVIALRNDGTHLVIQAKVKQAKKTLFRVILPESGYGEAMLSEDELLAECTPGYFLLVKLKSKLKKQPVIGVDDKRAANWLFGTFFKYRSYYYSAAMAALLANILTLAGTFFTMNVYDRVIPTQAYATLWALGIGVLVAILFEFISRQIRAHLVDMAGKKIDLVLGSFLFREFLITRMEFQPNSTGSFANQFREFESIRDFMSSATLATLSDIPFGFLFLFIIYSIGGPLIIVPLLLVPIIIIICIAVQWPLSKVMKENMRESSLKQGMLIESIAGIETLKAVRGEPTMQKKWEDFSALSAATSMKTKAITSTAMGLISTFQQICTVALVIYGVYLIGAGELTQGALIGTVILSGRIIAPLGALMGLAVRFQQAKVAVNSLTKFVELAVEKDAGKTYLSKPEQTGKISLKDISFSYPAPPMQPNPKVLDNISLDVNKGEKIAILGSIGSGKSTLLRILASLYQPTEGHVLYDGIDSKQIEPADIRASIGFIGQEAILFSGTLRENILLGNPIANATTFGLACRLAGVDKFANRHPLGYDMPVGEAGRALSGGQRQLVALARTLLNSPDIILMDEPTSNMDVQTEQVFLTQLNQVIKNQTIIVSTHRYSVLNIVDRIIILDGGKKVADGPKEQVLEALRKNKNTTNGES
ncbi:type I secretion system permease/ATPase [Thorsellia anophelis]|uniref:ATP-binding cassette, subfamily C, LapB n=1 Tax=Thorsellia anophelis DSM 18579 TaxID=1123402 RepID=A0A1I0DL49_9GAMM|nr:type I secretion system permease/ATPase [Thorsellia anophelis]SET33074.1 ATP-binding cassette, subfamily C, LapB [Thorsellia anophelis DSM 18579]